MKEDEKVRQREVYTSGPLPFSQTNNLPTFAVISVNFLLLLPDEVEDQSKAALHLTA